MRTFLSLAAAAVLVFAGYSGVSAQCSGCSCGKEKVEGCTSTTVAATNASCGNHETGCGGQATSTEKLTSAKEGEKCCGTCKEKEATVASFCPDKAQAIAVKIRSTECPKKSAEILATALPDLKCEKTMASLVSDIKAKGCEKEAAQVILTAAKQYAKPAAEEHSHTQDAKVLLAQAKEIILSVKDCDVEAAHAILVAAKKLAASVKKGDTCGGVTAAVTGSCSGAQGQETLAKVKEGASSCAKENAQETLVSLCPTKAQTIAVKIRATACPKKSAEILATVLPGLSCETTMAKLVSDIKAKGCEKEAAQVILAAHSKLNGNNKTEK